LGLCALLATLASLRAPRWGALGKDESLLQKKHYTVFGENSVLQVSDWRVESLADANGKKFPGYVSDLTTWIGLQ
jgi:hypothetical protein